MAELFKFFNSTETDKRLYQAEDFADFFAEFLSSGLVHRDNEPSLKVRAEGLDMKTYVDAGSAIVKGHLYKNTGQHFLQHEPSNGTEDRIDRIVLRYDGNVEKRYIKLFVKKGLPASYPSPPTLTREGNIHELSLAQVFIKSKSGSISELNVTDERLDEELCGLADSLITIPTEEFNDNFDKFKNQLNSDFYSWFDDAKRQSSIDLVQSELKLIKQNQIELLIQRYLEGKSTSMDAGYFYDVFKDYSKIDTNKTTAKVDIINMKVQLNAGSLEEELVFKPYNIGFIASKVKHFHTRPVGTLIPISSDALAGQNQIEVANISVTVTEVIGE